MRRIVLLVCCLLLLALTGQAEGLRVKTDSDIIGYAENRLLISAPSAGRITLTVSNRDIVLRTLIFDVPAGESDFVWDGLGAWEERIMDGTYTLTAVLNGETFSSPVTVGRCRQALLYAFPLQDTIHTNDENHWYAELGLVRGGTVVMEVRQSGTLITKRTREVSDDTPYRFAWTGKNGDSDLPEGMYTLIFYAENNPERNVSFDVTILNDTSPILPVEATGPIIPERGDSDETIWAMMQAPAVIVSVGGATAHQNIYAEPSKKSTVLGTLHNVSQCVEVLALEGDWVRIAAWNHEDGSYTEGYVQRARLSRVVPDDQYGVLVDKQTQTLTVYEYGKPIAVIPVSTGLADATHPFRETAAGSFLTETRIGNFAQSGYRYRYVIRYDGGNLLHSIGYKLINSRMDFTEQLPKLGQKASHGCIRLPCGDTGLPNAYWLYTHLPPRTRILIIE